MQASTLSVVHRYLQGGFWSFDPGRFKPDSSKPTRRRSVRYATLVAFFVVMSGVLYLCAKRCAARRDRRDLALILACWFSILAPLSWFVIFKAHSYSHLAINFIVWQMPFTFFGAAVAGLARPKRRCLRSHNPPAVVIKVEQPRRRLKSRDLRQG